MFARRWDNVFYRELDLDRNFGDYFGRCLRRWRVFRSAQKRFVRSSARRTDDLKRHFKCYNYPEPESSSGIISKELYWASARYGAGAN